MYSTREHGVEMPRKSIKDKKLSKLINNSDTDTGNESEHELSFYMEDRVKLMKEVLKIIKPKKIKNMAPDCMKKMRIEEINSILLEELLGISKKRLKYIFEGKSLDEESSTDEDQPIDVISLDDISDDDFVIISDEETDKNNKKKKRRKIKEEPKDKSKKIKKEKFDKGRSKEKEKTKDKEKEKEKEKTTSKEPMGEENLMSVLELLELQARARAIRSQLDLESKRKNEQERLEKEKAEKMQENGQDDDEEIIIEVPKEVEIVITSSDSENEEQKQTDNNKVSTSKENTITTAKTISTLRNSINENASDSHIQINENFSPGSIANKLQIQENTELHNEKSIRHKISIEQKGEGDTYKIGKGDSNSDKEEGEVSDGESHEKDKFDKRVDLSAIPIPDNGKKKSNENTERDTSSESSDLSSDSNDNLQVVMLREKRKKRTFEKSVRTSTAKNSMTESVGSENGLPKDVEDKKINNNSSVENNKNPSENKSANKKIIDKKLEKDVDQNNDCKSKSDGFASQNIVSEGETNVSDLQSEDNDSQQSKSKIENAIAEFMKTQPPPLDETEELKKMEEESKKHEERAKHIKEKRLKNLKNKLQSYKKDVEGESSVTILENIVIKPVDSGKNRKRVADDSDDLVINVDQDDLDCIICD